MFIHHPAGRRHPDIRALHPSFFQKSKPWLLLRSQRGSRKIHTGRDRSTPSFLQRTPSGTGRQDLFGCKDCFFPEILIHGRKQLHRHGLADCRFDRSLRICVYFRIGRRTVGEESLPDRLGKTPHGMGRDIDGIQLRGRQACLQFHIVSFLFVRQILAPPAAAPVTAPAEHLAEPQGKRGCFIKQPSVLISGPTPAGIRFFFVLKEKFIGICGVGRIR